MLMPEGQKSKFKIATGPHMVKKVKAYALTTHYRVLFALIFKLSVAAG